MFTVQFDYKTSKTEIQSISEDKMRQICFKFSQKIQIDLNNIYFIYSGNILNLDLSVEQIINKEDKKRKIMSIIVNDYSYESQNKSKIISPYIICPICKETARFELKNYKFRIYNCKNGHDIQDILIKDFQNTQIIDESLIKCDKCKKNNKSNTYNREMYICNLCNMNLCPLCKSIHNKNHKIINYEQKYYICNIHNKEYNSYCETCNKDLCEFCKKEHREHELISYADIIPENMISEEEIKVSLNGSLNVFKFRISMIIDRLNNVMKNMEIIFKLIEKNLLNYNINNINYNILQNINYNYKNDDIYFADITDDLINFDKDKNYKELIPNILKMYNGMNKNEIDLIYNIPKGENKIKIFGNEFVKRNKDLCKIIYDNNEYDLITTFECKNNKDNILKIKLKGINNLTNIESMFEECSQLSSLTNFSNWDTTYVTAMLNLFKDSKCLELPDISNLITNNVMNMYGLFQGCSLVKSLPDISNWNTSKVVCMNSMFKGCSSLKLLPDISNWDTRNVRDMTYMFEGCSSLKSLPNISKWDIELALKCNEINGGINGIFDDCSEFLNIPEKFKKVD